MPPLGWSAQTSGVATSLNSVDAVSPAIAWAAGNGGVVLRTTNGGTTWTSVGGGAITTEDIYAIDAVDANLAIVTTTPGASTFIYRTTDGGASWTSVYTLAGGFMDGLHMFDATNGIALGDPVGGLWVIPRTTDGGATWTRIATEPAQVGTEAGWNNSFHVKGTTDFWFGTGGTRVYRSTDGGATWSSSATTGVLNTFGVWFNDLTNGVAAGSAGVRSTDGGGSWSPSTIPGTGSISSVGGGGQRDFWAIRGTSVYHSINFGASYTSEYTAVGTKLDIGFITVGDSTWGWVVSDNGTIGVYYNANTPPPVAPVHDIGILNLQESRPQAPPASQQMRGASLEQAHAEVPEPITFVESAPVNLKVFVQNFGNVTETSYQVGWSIDGAGQTPVSSTDSLTVSDTDTLTITWAVPTIGLHTIRAWTILAGDTTRTNDSASFNIKILPANVAFFEGFNGTTFPPAGWITINRDGGGTLGPWIAGVTSNFPSLEGNSYAADHYNTANGFYIDDYLVSPNTGYTGTSTDSLSFWVRHAGATATFPDSMEIRVSTTGTDTSNFTILLAYIEIPGGGGWTKFSYPLPNTANRYIAFRYLMYDGGPFGNSSNYFGVDDIRITRTGGSTTLNVAIATGWNLISNPVTNPVPGDSVLQMYPTSLNPYAFEFAGGYVQRFKLANGKGYWGKFPASISNPVTGTPRTRDSVSVVAGWNIVGSISNTVDTNTIVSVPPGLRASNWFGYTAGYTAVTQLVPGKGYWVKSTGAGKFVLANPLARPAGQGSGTTLADVLNTLTITDANGGSQTLYFGADGQKQIPVAMYVMPPAPPVGAFDARFETADGGSMVQTHGAELSTSVEFAVSVQSEAYPLTITWKVANASYAISAGASQSNMTGEGSMKITNSSVNKFSVKLLGEGGLPKEFALSQNYPNPFNPTTNIKYALPVDSKVTMEIYNVIGQRVRTLVSDNQPAGYHAIEWNSTGTSGQQLGSGVYFLHLSAQGVNGASFNEIRKLMLLK